MKFIEVWHRQEASMALVAVVDVSGAHPDAQPWQLLEHAWRWTNNVEGSWSRPQHVGGNPDPNRDFREDVHVMAELPVHGGVLYGLRSSMVGDVFVIDGDPAQAHVVASFGFAEIDGWQDGNINFQAKADAA